MVPLSPLDLGMNWRGFIWRSEKQSKSWNDHEPCR
jgi:hypothetical protein